MEARKKYKCETCGKVFIKRSRLTQHEIIHTGERPFECDKCGKTFMRNSHLKRHKVIHTGIKGFPCTKDGCNLAFSTLHNLKRHEGRAHGRPFKCTFEGCSATFAKKSQLWKHTCAHENLMPYKCDVEGCRKEYKTVHYLRRHQKSHDLGYFCSESGCSERFSSFHQLKQHMTSHEKKEFKCSTCGKTFKTENVLKNHAVVHDSERELFKCSKCDKVYTKRSFLDAHMQSYHNKIKSFVCSHKNCGQVFIYLRSLQRHLEMHENQEISLKNKPSVKSHACPAEECGQFFAHKRSVHRHVKRYHKELFSQWQAEKLKKESTSESEAKKKKKKKKNKYKRSKKKNKDTTNKETLKLLGINTPHENIISKLSRVDANKPQVDIDTTMKKTSEESAVSVLDNTNATCLDANATITDCNSADLTRIDSNATMLNTKQSGNSGTCDTDATLLDGNATNVKIIAGDSNESNDKEIDKIVLHATDDLKDLAVTGSLEVNSCIDDVLSKESIDLDVNDFEESSNYDSDNSSVEYEDDGNSSDSLSEEDEKCFEENNEHLTMIDDNENQESFFLSKGVQPNDYERSVQLDAIDTTKTKLNDKFLHKKPGKNIDIISNDQGVMIMVMEGDSDSDDS